MRFLKIFLLVCMLFTIGCETNEVEDIMNNQQNNEQYNSDENNNENDEITRNYYIKYHYIISSGCKQYCSAVVEYTDSNYNKRKIEYANARTHEYDVICGPFNYNDTVELNVVDTYNVYSILCEIYVSMNDEPFTLRYYDNSRNNTYTIDYN